MNFMQQFLSILWAFLYNKILVLLGGLNPAAMLLRLSLQQGTEPFRE